MRKSAHLREDFLITGRKKKSTAFLTHPDNNNGVESVLHTTERVSSSYCSRSICSSRYIEKCMLLQFFSCSRGTHTINVA